MATGTSGSTTTNFDLILPGYEDDTDVDDLNENFKTIDGELYDATQAIAQNASAIQTVRDSLALKSKTITGISLASGTETTIGRIDAGSLLVGVKCSNGNGWAKVSVTQGDDVYVHAQNNASYTVSFDATLYYR